MGEAFLPIGSEFQIGDQHSAETFTKVAELNRISGVGWSRDMKDVTTLDDTYQKLLPGLRKGDVVTLDLNFTVANWDRFRDIFETEDDETDALDYRTVIKAGAITKYTFEFNGFVQGIKLGDVQPDEKLSMQAMVQITGLPVESSGA